MTDQLSLSIWLDRHAQANRLRHFQSLLRLFPFSQRDKQPQSTISILAVDSTEPPLLEKAMNGPLDPDAVDAVLGDYKGPDVAFRVESWWDLWQFENEWRLIPSAVTLSCFGRQFDNGTERGATEQEDLRIDFGVDSHYLPQPEVQGSTRMVESNIKSLLRLVSEIDSTLPVSKRVLETESGTNFGERLQQMLTAVGKVQ